ncbi:DUF1624 domain-containing protein [Shewanella sp. A14]
MNTIINKKLSQTTDVIIDQPKNRITAIDALRGLVMLLMLVDHVRERFFYHHVLTDPMTLADTDTSLFATRMLTHLCAPVFVFLTGLSAWLYAHPHNKPERSPQHYLLKRGLFLIVIEITLINFSWFGNYQALYLQVIWAIGISMIALALVVNLPRWFIGVLGIGIIFGHNSLTFISFSTHEWGYHLWTILHDRGYLYLGESFKIKASYPVLPWIGVIFIGYFSGTLYTHKTEAQQRKKWLLMAGAGSLLSLLILRGLNLYGETMPWIVSSNLADMCKSFFNFSKYPPSLLFLLLTLGVGVLLLVLLEKAGDKITKLLSDFGSAPMFFYILHLYLLLITYRIVEVFFEPNHGDYRGVDHIWQIWGIAIAIAIMLYFPTTWFAEVKRNSQSIWIKYF